MSQCVLQHLVLYRLVSILLGYTAERTYTVSNNIAIVAYTKRRYSISNCNAQLRTNGVLAGVCQGYWMVSAVDCKSNGRRCLHG